MTSFWRTVSDRFPWAQRMQRELRLAEAYRSVFRGRASSEDQEIVLADLMLTTGFAMVMPEGTSSDALQRSEGRRDVMARIRSFLNLSPADVDAIENAARREASVRQNEQGYSE